MTKDKRKYARKRIDNLIKVAKNNLKPAFKVESKWHDADTIRSLYDAGKIEPTRVRKYNDTLKLTFERPLPGERESSFDQEGFEAAMQPIRKKAQAAKDQIMLGDAQEALNLIHELSNMIEGNNEDSE